ncbi:MAG: hypothetical protein AAF978_03140, partial [Cyanobacteria bacterium P01_E01_bin.48]
SAKAKFDVRAAAGPKAIALSLPKIATEPQCQLDSEAILHTKSGIWGESRMNFLLSGFKLNVQLPNQAITQ